MNYLRVKWLHSFPNEPIWLIIELDEGRRETRKIEIFPDGCRGYAMSGKEVCGTRLGEAAVPSIAQIAVDPQFIPAEITRDEFEEIWQEQVICR